MIWLLFHPVLIAVSQQKGGAIVVYLINLFVLVTADVVAYCIRKWLDQHNKEQ